MSQSVLSDEIGKHRPIPIAVAFHAERLDDDRVWQRVERIARWMAREGISATFFVYPFRSQIAGRDIAGRIRSLADLGHEIGQHTHFYAGTNVDKPEKIDDFREANIVHCLQRDFGVLRDMGCRPRGFTAGAWVVNEIALDTLVRLGFAYDCSARLRGPTGMVAASHYRWLEKPQRYATDLGSLLCLPTTCSLGEWFKWGRKVRLNGKFTYQLVFLHDYDLISYRGLVLWNLLSIVKGDNFMPAGRLAERLSREET